MDTEVIPILKTVETNFIGTLQAIQQSNDPLKTKNLHFDALIEISAFMYNTFKLDLKEGIVDVDAGFTMAGNLYTFVQYLKRKKNAENENTLKYSAFTLKGPGSAATTSYTVSSFFTMFNSKFPDAYKKLDYQILMPIAVVITNMKTALEEVRMGLNSVPKGLIPKGITVTRKRSADQSNITAPLAVLGLTNIHSPLLHGLTFPPEKKTVMLKGLGPMTLAAMLMSQPRFTDKIRQAFVENLGHVEMADKIADALLLGKDNCSGLMRSLADYLLITSHKGVRRFYFPLEWYMQMYILVGREGLCNQFSFNGIAMLKLYCHYFQIKFNIRGDVAYSDILREYMFHGMFTGGLENLLVLKQITTYELWHIRRDMSEALKSRNTKPYILLSPIVFTHISKGARALPSNMGINNIPMYTGDMRFAGKRTREFSQEFRTYLKSGKVQTVYDSSTSSLISALNILKTEAEKDMDKPDFREVGSAEWSIVNYAEGVTFTSGADFRVIEGAYSYFYV